MANSQRERIKALTLIDYCIILQTVFIGYGLKKGHCFYRSPTFLNCVSEILLQQPLSTTLRQTVFSHYQWPGTG